MTPEQAFSEVLELIRPHAKNEAALRGATRATKILEDLEVNSARLVDIVLALEDRFDIEVLDDEVDQVVTIGDAVDLILAKVT